MRACIRAAQARVGARARGHLAPENEITPMRVPGAAISAAVAARAVVTHTHARGTASVLARAFARVGRGRTKHAEACAVALREHRVVVGTVTTPAHVKDLCTNHKP